MPTEPKPKAKSPSIAFFVILGAALFAFIQIFSLLAPILLSLLLTLLISLAINPLIIWLRGFTGGRKVATGLITFALIGVIGLTGWAFFVPLKASITNLSQQLPGYWERLQKPLIKMEQKAVLSEQKLQAEVTAEIAQNAPETNKPAATQAVTQQTDEPSPAKPANESGTIRSGLGQMLRGVAGSFTAVAFNAAQILVVLVTVFFGVIFTLMNPRPIFGSIFLIVPERHHDKTLTIIQRIGNFVPGWVGSTLMGMLTIGVLVFLLMWPIFGFMDALVLGLIAGILESIPFIGPILSAVPALLFALGKGGMTPLWVILAYLAIQALENNVILPLIMSRGMKLHPVAVIFSMLLCVAAFGVLGVLVAAPLVGIVDILHDELYRKRFLPTVTDTELANLSRKALHEKVPPKK